MLESVITIHGIWSEGLWQENVAPVLYPHFRPISVKYPYYQWLGPFDLLFEPYVLVIGAILWAASSFFHQPHEFIVAHWILLLAGWVIIAVACTAVRLRAAMNLIRQETAHAIAAGAQPHIIAHSLGSFLFATALKQIPPMRAQRIVLAGCVLRRKFKWEILLERKTDAFDAIRNEVAGKDWVAGAAMLLCWRFWDFGSAGRHGFLGSAPFVHDVKDHGGACQSCSASTSPARLHNFSSPHLGHSGVLETSDFASNYWLPFFFDIEPKEFHLFLRLCSGIVTKLPDAIRGRAAGKLPDEQFGKIGGKLLLERWGWAGGARIEEFIQSQIERYHSEYTSDHKKMNDLIKQVVIGVCRAVDDARDALSEKLNESRSGERPLARYDSPTRDSRIIALNPRQAVSKALQTAVEQEQSHK